jgi:hypothetical protein
VDLPSALASHLRGLVDSIGSDDSSLSVSLDALASLLLRTAVSSYLGFRLTLVVDGWPITLTAFSVVDGERPATSLRLNLSSQGPGFDPDSQIVLYASQAGAFIDLAADIEYLHRRSHSVDGDGARAAAALDLDLPPITLVSGFIGLAEYTTINRAIGMLIQRGHDPADAHATLHRDASSSGLALHRYVARLLKD